MLRAMLVLEPQPDKNHLYWPPLQEQPIYQLLKAGTYSWTLFFLEDYLKHLTLWTGVC